MEMGYNKKYLDYVCVNDIGELFKPDYLTQHFVVIQQKHNIKHIRFHDLRHSCASLMLANSIPMKQIQEWLGHSTFNTTADIYAHLDFSSKISSANTISNALDFNEPNNINVEIDISGYKQSTEILTGMTLDEEIAYLEDLVKNKIKEKEQAEL